MFYIFYFDNSYIYTDDIELKPQLVMFILHASKKYLLNGLTNKCTEYLSGQLDVNNTCAILDQSLIFDEEELVSKCTDLIENHTKDCLESESFLDISQKTLSIILDFDRFSAAEEDVFSGCLRWAKSKCESMNKECSGVNMRDVLRECVTKIRFTNIDIHAFVGLVAPTGILTQDQEIELYRYIVNKDLNPEPKEFCVRGRFDVPGPYAIVTEEKITCSKLGNTEISVDIISLPNIEVYSFIIGNYNATNCNIQGANHSTKTILKAVTYGSTNISGNATGSSEFPNKQEWKLDEPLVLKPAETKFNFNFTNSHRNIFGAGENAVSQVSVVNGNVVKLSDDKVAITLKSSQPFLPILGLTYRLVKCTD